MADDVPPMPGTAVAPSRSVAESRLEPAIAFDLPSQPLAAALDRYAALSGRSVVFADALVDGRRSAPVVGRHTSLSALRAMLEGTGLEADVLPGRHAEAFVLKPRAAVPAFEASTQDRRYDGRVQSRVLAALCADALTRPGGYRALLRLRVDAAGRVRDPDLLDSTGDRLRDAAVRAALDGLSIGGPPPAALRQPLTLIILPLDNAAARAICPGEP